MKSLPHLRDAARHAATPLSLICLQLALSLFYWSDDLGAADLLTPTWELPAVIALLVGLAWRPRPRLAERLARVIVTVLVFVFVFLGFAQRFAKFQFGYDVLLAIDSKYVPELFRMMFRAESLPVAIFHCVLIALAVGVVVVAIHRAVAHLHRVAGLPEQRRRLVTGFVPSFALLAVFLGVNGPLTREAAKQLDLALHKQARIGFIASQMETQIAHARGPEPFQLGAWQPDILVFVVESYGAALFDQPRFSGFRDFVTEQAAELSASGYTMRSRYMVSPVFGGSSWMAFATLMCGVKVNNQRRHEGLKVAAVECLPELLNRAGYETVFAAANTTHFEGTLKRLMPFKRRILQQNFGYKGPTYGWSLMPDQFAIERIDQQVIAPRAPGAPPLFMVYMLTSSHHPWSHIPPWIEDRSKLGDGEIYAGRSGIEFPGNQFVSGTHYPEGYDASMRYSLRSVFTYLRQLPPDKQPLVIVLGDHQPRKPVAEMRRDDWWVPVYVLSRDAHAVERFAAQGYQPGIVPDRAGPAVPLDRFLDRLLAVLAAAPTPPPASAASSVVH